MKDYEIKYLEKRLKSEADKIDKMIKDNKDTGFDSSIRKSIEELSMYDNHPADVGSETYEMEKQIALKNHYEKQKHEITEAIERFNNGNYGMCSFCGKEIGFERLEAIPTAKLCIDCEKSRKVELEDLENDRPVEEDVLTYPYIESYSGAKQINGYDREDSWQDVARFNKTENQALDWYDNNFYDEDQEEKVKVQSIENISNQEYEEQLNKGNAVNKEYVEDKRKKGEW